MPERCTCGAVLPEDALFCHKCGKPQREDLIPVEAAPPPPAPIPVLPVAPPRPVIGFHNRIAVRIGLLVGTLSILASGLSGAVPVLLPFSVVWLVAGGFLAVFLYKRRTGQRLSAINGAHLGWICGVFEFAFATILLTAIIVMLSDPAMVSALQEQMKEARVPEANVKSLNQLIETIHNPSAIIGSLLGSFVLLTILPAFGGLIGAKFLDRD